MGNVLSTTETQADVRLMVQFQEQYGMDVLPDQLCAPHPYGMSADLLYGFERFKALGQF
jgi:hypothetical protein